MRWKKAWETKEFILWTAEIPERDRKAMMKANAEGKSILNKTPWWFPVRLFRWLSRRMP